jgi:hypothetical protein
MNAVRYQQIIMFMISAATALGVLGSVIFCIQVLIDKCDRLRPERILDGSPSILHDIKYLLVKSYHGLKYLLCCHYCRHRHPTKDQDDHNWNGLEQDNGDDDQRQPLLQ